MNSVPDSAGRAVSCRALPQNSHAGWIAGCRNYRHGWRRCDKALCRRAELRQRSGF